MTHKKKYSGIWMIVWIVAFVAIAYLVSPQSNWLFTKWKNIQNLASSYPQQTNGSCSMARNTTTQWCGWCGGSRTTATTTQTNNTVDTTNTYETVNVWHDEYALVPETVTLTAGKSYKLVITPTADGGWCMNNMTLPWLDSNVYPVKKGVPVTIVINNAKAGTYEVVCGNMGMYQWTINIQ